MSGTQGGRVGGARAPRVSVILPVYNGERTVEEASNSILSQTFSDLELLLIDDGSTDGTAKVLEKILRSDARVRVIRNERNLGLAKTLNNGIAEARGQWVARQDADDISLPHRLENCMNSASPGCFLVSRWLIDDGRSVWEPLSSKFLLIAPAPILRFLSRFINFFAHGSFFFDRDAVVRLGGYDERFALSQDFDLIQRVSRAMCFIVLRSPGYIFRMRGGIGGKKSELQVSYAMASCVGREPDPNLMFQGWTVVNRLIGTVFLLANMRRYRIAALKVFLRLWTGG